MFKKQIEEDIKKIQSDYIENNPLLIHDEYAFNYWVLTKIYNIDEEVVESNITEYHDDGVDCFVFFEEAKELYIIQNKYYNESSKLDKKYIINDFLNRPIPFLCANAYRRSLELQEKFNKYKSDIEFKIHLYFYVTTDEKDPSIRETFQKFQYSNNELKCYVDADIFYLNDIKNQYFEDDKADTKEFKCEFLTKNRGTVLQINSNEYNLPDLIDAKYILTPVKLIYDIVKNANEKKYSLFEENVREYLGIKGKGVNSYIAETLKNEKDRSNFFYYNNGITIICDQVKEDTISTGNYNKSYTAINPQIVNGCQTVNTIYEVLKRMYDEKNLDEEFKSTFVMVKLLVLNKDDEGKKILYQDIVKYNNSQNAISEKNFAANKRAFLNIQKYFETRGFLLAVKQSDTYKFKNPEKYLFNHFRPLLVEYERLFNVKFEKIDDIIIPLEKLLQVLLCFRKDGYYAFTKKSQVLKLNSTIYTELAEFIKSGELTFDQIIKIYLLFFKAEKEKKESEDNRTPIPYYLLGFIGNEFKNISVEDYKSKFEFIFSNKDNFDCIYDFYKWITQRYKMNYKKEKELEYNQMIKSPIDYETLYNTINEEYENYSDKQVKCIVSEFRKNNSSEIICNH